MKSAERKRVMIGICTYRRPAMLSECLTSVDNLVVPEAVDLAIVVIDNDALKSAKHVVEKHMAHHKQAIRYVCEAQKGLVCARNAALESALQCNADLICFLDDDQTVPVNWLCAMLEAHNQTGADVIQTALRRVSTDGKIIQNPVEKWDMDLEMAATGGVLFTRRLIALDGMNQRFDLRFNFCGGEDRYFFVSARLAGAKIVRTPEAVAVEHVVKEKFIPWVVFKRRFNDCRVAIGQDVELKGRMSAVKKIVCTYPLPLYKGFVSLLLGGLVWSFSREYARKKFSKAARNLGESLGALRGLFGINFDNPYAQSHGF